MNRKKITCFFLLVAILFVLGMISFYKLLLTTDAYTHINQPFWKDYRYQIFKQMETVKRKSSLIPGDNQGFIMELNISFQQFQTIKPALSPHISPEWVREMESLYRFLSKEENMNQSIKVKAAVKRMEEMYSNLFSYQSMKTSYFVGGDAKMFLIAGIFSTIILALSYVGWRKYKGERRLRRSL